MIWKSVNPPHLDCTTHTGGPIAGRDVYNRPGDVSDKYGHANVEVLDTFWRGVIASGRTFFKLLDMRPLYQRPDAHVRGANNDCLHYCQPGALDIFSRLLLQMLLTGDIL